MRSTETRVSETGAYDVELALFDYRREKRTRREVEKRNVKEMGIVLLFKRKLY